MSLLRRIAIANRVAEVNLRRKTCDTADAPELTHPEGGDGACYILIETPTINE